MQKNPTWTVPNSEWAGDLAGKVIPGGDPKNPLIARWIGFNGSVGFHGTKSIDSLGRSASHGCVRMAPEDVKDLYERVQKMSDEERELCVVGALHAATAPSIHSLHSDLPSILTPEEPGGSIPETHMPAPSR